ncbi:maleylpyruvate isomerase N-terminal domain-containing protein [Nocardiopsis sp. CNT-189]|uniref:maleylpyruvate isomerase N-terminal domain-containing protein n=1 Tax=Nocardiopsis oceanisediminis TaxID=2816862 RepID=UPI003B2ADC5B
MPDRTSSSPAASSDDPREEWAALLERSVAACAAALRRGADADWSAPAGGLDWTCTATAVHVWDDMFGYATQLTGRRTGGYVAFEVVADDGVTPEQLAQGLEASGGVLAAAVRTTPPEVRAWHPYGDAGPIGFAAMGMVEALVHTHDIAAGLGLEFTPPEEPVARALARLFPQAPGTGDPWAELLWCTGRGALPGRAAVEGAWRWRGEGP